MNTVHNILLREQTLATLRTQYGQDARRKFTPKCTQIAGNKIYMLDKLMKGDFFFPKRMKWRVSR